MIRSHTTNRVGGLSLYCFQELGSAGNCGAEQLSGTTTSSSSTHASGAADLGAMQKYHSSLLSDTPTGGQCAPDPVTPASGHNLAYNTKVLQKRHKLLQEILFLQVINDDVSAVVHDLHCEMVLYAHPAVVLHCSCDRDVQIVNHTHYPCAHHIQRARERASALPHTVLQKIS